MRYFLISALLWLLGGCAQTPSTPVVSQPETDAPKIALETQKSVCPTVHPPEVVCPAIHPCAPCPKPKPCKPIIMYKEPKKVVLGEIEESYLPVYKVFLKARVDTGAQTSSMHAKEIVPFERDGEKWVRFSIMDDHGKEIQIKKPIVKKIKIKRHGTEAQERYVVHMRLNISTISQYLEVSLTDREDYRYPVLIGRNFLQGNALVDVSRHFTKMPTKVSR